MSHATVARTPVQVSVRRPAACRPAIGHRSDGAIAAAARRAPLLRGLRTWLGLGLLALALVPAARGSSAWIGWLPFWLAIAPLSMLAVLEHVRLAGAVDALLASGRRRRLHARRPQARPIANAQRHGQRRARAA